VNRSSDCPTCLQFNDSLNGCNNNKVLPYSVKHGVVLAKTMGLDGVCGKSPYKDAVIQIIVEGRSV
jgi:hypothetical protein